MNNGSDAPRGIPYRTALTLGPVLMTALLVGGCGTEAPSSASTTALPSTAGASVDSTPNTRNADHPDVLAAVLEPDGSGAWALTVTLSSQYDSPERYADGWRVLDADGAVLGQHTLTHDHADEQPVTRTQTGLAIPDDVDLVTIEGSDTANGYGGRTLEVEVPR